jgi:hypothetical protein
MPTPSSRGTRGPARGGSSYSRGGGGSTNAVAYAFAVIIVIGVVIMIIAMSSGKKAPPVKAPPPVESVPVATVTKPVKASEKPYPAMPAAKVDEARRLVSTFEADGAKGKRLYDESLAAKKAGNDAEWQSKLKEARGLLEDIRDKWNDFIATLPSSKDYDVEQVAMHYFSTESGKVTRLTKPLAAMKSDER